MDLVDNVINIIALEMEDFDRDFGGLIYPVLLQNLLARFEICYSLIIILFCNLFADASLVT